METFAEYLDAVKSTTRFQSDKQIAEFLGVSRQYLSKCRKGEKSIAYEHLIQLCREAGIDQDFALLAHTYWSSKGLKKTQLKHVINREAIPSWIITRCFPYILAASFALDANFAENPSKTRDLAPLDVSAELGNNKHYANKA